MDPIDLQWGKNLLLRNHKAQSFHISVYTEKKVIRGHFSNSFLIYKPCSKFNDFLPKDLSIKTVKLQSAQK